jgi:hypothetical protein
MFNARRAVLAGMADIARRTVAGSSVVHTH